MVAVCSNAPMSSADATVIPSAMDGRWWELSNPLYGHPMDDTPAPILGISAAEAAHIVGVTRSHIYRLVLQERLSKGQKHQRFGLDRDEVERLALARWNGRSRHAYWLNTAQAAELLGISQQRVQQLIAQGSLPAVRRGRQWVLRRRQLEVIANARAARYGR